MAKANFYLYGSRGKVGNLIARKGPRGGTVLSERVTNPKNPRTNKQMSQRIILSTVAQATKFLSPIIDHSFEDKTRGVISKDYFRKINMNRLRNLAAIDFSEGNKAVECNAFTTTKNIEALIPNSYIVSEGNLGPSKLSVSLDNGQHQVGMGKDFVIDMPRATVNTVVGDTNGVRYITIGSMLQALFGITSAGEQLTFVGIEKTGEGYKYAYANDPSYAGWMIPYTDLIARRLYVDISFDLSEKVAVTDNQGVALDNIDDIITNKIIEAFNNKRTDDVLLEWLDDHLRATLAAEYLSGEKTVLITTGSWNFTQDNASDDDLGYLYALGIIRSRLKEDGSWQYSKCILSLNLPTSDVTTNFGLDWNSSVQAWFEGNEVAQNPEYLQASTENNTIGESFT